MLGNIIWAPCGGRMMFFFNFSISTNAMSAKVIMLHIHAKPQIKVYKKMQKIRLDTLGRDFGWQFCDRSILEPLPTLQSKNRHHKAYSSPSGDYPAVQTAYKRVPYTLNWLQVLLRRLMLIYPHWNLGGFEFSLWFWNFWNFFKKKLRQLRLKILAVISTTIVWK